MVMDDSSRSRHGRPSTTPVTIPRRKRGCGWNGGPQRGQFVALGSCIPCPACTRSCVCVFSCSLQYEIRWGGVVAWKMGQTLWTGIRIFLSSCFPCFTSYDDYDFFSLLCEREKREKEDWGKKTCGWWWWRGGVLAAAWWRYYCLFWAMTWRRRWGMGREKRVVAFVSC